jgi:uroporphyrinogen decarboxylase
MERKEMIFMTAARGKRPKITPIVIEVQMVVSPTFKRILNRYGFDGIVSDAALSAQCTVMPVTELGFDAAIHMSDLLVPVKAMGLKIQHSLQGPIVENPVRNMADVERLSIPEPEEGMKVWLEALRIAKGELRDKVPIIGWVGGPFSMASFIVEGKVPYPFTNIKRLMYSDPKTLHGLLSKLTEMCIRFIPAQVKAGADVMMILDLGSFALSPREYQEFAFPYVMKIVSAVKSATNVPIFHHADGTSFLSSPIADLDIDIIGFDWTINLEDGIKKIDRKKVVFGNLEPYCLFGDNDLIERRVREIFEAGKAAPAHIFSLGGWVIRDTPFEKVKFLVDLVHSL